MLAGNSNWPPLCGTKVPLWPRLQNQPVQTLYWLVNQFVPPEDWKHGSRPGNTLVVQFDWEVVQSLYWLLFEQSSPSIPVAIDCTKITTNAVKASLKVNPVISPSLCLVRLSARSKLNRFHFFSTCFHPISTVNFDLESWYERREANQILLDFYRGKGFFFRCAEWIHVFFMLYRLSTL